MTWLVYRIGRGNQYDTVEAASISVDRSGALHFENGGRVVKIMALGTWREVSDASDREDMRVLLADR